MKSRTHLAVAGTTALTVALACACDAPNPTAPRAAIPNAPFGTVASSIPLPPASDFVALADNPYYPLIPGTTFQYHSDTPDGTEINTVEVTHDTRMILGIAATVVHDRVYLDGELTEDTYDWYAQDVEGNVWYLGEFSCEIEGGQCASTEGSWEAGVSGATAGIIMWANPAAHRGETYRQEFLEGEAEDVAKVLRSNASVETPYGSFTGCLETMDWSLLEPADREHKFYCPGTGLVLEVSPSGGRVKNELENIQSP